MFRFAKIGRNFKLSNELVLTGFFFTIGFAIVESMFSLYLSDMFNLTKSHIGMIITLFNLASILVAICSSKIIEKYHEKKLMVASILGILAVFVMMYFNDYLVLFIFLGIFVYIFQVLRIISFNILYRDNSKRGELNKNESVLYAILNVAWLIAPILGGFYLSLYKPSGLFLFAGFFIMIGLFLYLVLDVKESRHKIKAYPENPVKIIKRFFLRKKYRKIYFVSSWFSIVTGFVWTFLPILMLEHGFSKSHVGIFLALMILPFVVFEFKVDNIVKIIGYKRTFYIGYLLPVVFFLFAFLFENYFIKIGCVLIGYSAGALIEPTRESYFFKKTSQKDEEDFYPIFATNIFFGLFISRVFFSLLFMVTSSSNFAFLAISVLMIFPIFVIRNFKD